jgi:hypothetical protein
MGNRIPVTAVGYDGGTDPDSVSDPSIGPDETAFRLKRANRLEPGCKRRKSVDVAKMAVFVADRKYHKLLTLMFETHRHNNEFDDGKHDSDIGCVDCHDYNHFNYPDDMCEEVRGVHKAKELLDIARKNLDTVLLEQARKDCPYSDGYCPHRNSLDLDHLVDYRHVPTCGFCTGWGCLKRLSGDGVVEIVKHLVEHEHSAANLRSFSEWYGVFLA